MSERFKQTVLVDNRPGADEIIAASVVKGAPKDGYTLMIATEQSLILNSFLHKKLPYNAETDFVPVSRLAEGHTVLVVPSDSKARNVREFVDRAKQEPGKVNYAWSGVNRIPMGAFTQMTGISVTYVGYKGGMAPIMQDLLAGRVDATLAAQIAVAQYISTGRVRGLAVSGKARSAILPSVPTFAEAGYPDYSATFYIGLMAPTGTPVPIVEMLAAASQSIIRDPAFVQKYLVPSGLEPIADAPAEFSAFLRAERPLAEKKVEAAGMKAE
jgi:tripartite-type tricarboxylate transporter receptor subunit TctC